MKKIGIFYGSTTGNTEEIAQEIAQKIDNENVSVYNVDSASESEIENLEICIFGSSTWGFGDLQDDWESFIVSIKKIDFSGKKVAFFGCGDSACYPDTFCDAMGIIYDAIKDNGMELIGAISKDEYSFDDSASLMDDKLLGLAIDFENESEKTKGRIEDWTKDLLPHLQ